MMRSKTMMAFATISALAFSCSPKKSSKTSIQSLDNLANGSSKHVTNMCKWEPSGQLAKVAPKLLPQWEGRITIGLDVDGSISKAHKEKYIAKVQQYLGAVPEEMQKAFLKLGGEIQLTGQAVKECNREYAAQNSSQFVREGKDLAETCLIYSNGLAGAPTEGKAVMVILHQINIADMNVNNKERTSNDSSWIADKNEVRIMHSGVRSFGMAFSQFFSKLSLKDRSAIASANPSAVPMFDQVAKYDLMDKDTTAMIMLKSQLANRFLLDVARNKKFDLVNLEPLLGAGSAKQILSSLPSGFEKETLSPEKVDSLNLIYKASYLFKGEASISAAEKEKRMLQFQDFVMGEGLDSILCSDATRKVLTDDFVYSQVLVSELKAAIIMLSSKLSGDAKVESSLVENEDGRGSGRSASSGLSLQGQGTPAQGNNVAQDIQTGQNIGNVINMFTRLFGGMMAPGNSLFPNRATNAIANTRPPQNGSTCSCATCMGNGCQGCGNGQTCSGPGCTQRSGGVCPPGVDCGCASGNCGQV